MANYQDQAQAIWSALDTMLTQDPEGYKRFVTEQLEEGRKMVKKDASKSNNSQPFTGAKGSGGQQPMFDLEGAFGMLGVRESSDKTKSGTTPSRHARKKGNVPSKKVDSEVGGNGASKLLDDEIGGKRSILEQIVKNEGGESDEEDAVKLTALELPAKVTKKAGGERASKKKLLIEEL